MSTHAASSLQFLLLLLAAGLGSGCELIVAPDRSLISDAGGAGPGSGGGGSGAGGGEAGQGGGAECTTNEECGTDTACQTFTCSGEGECVTTNLPDTTPCGVAGTECKIQDTCDGRGACSDNGFEPSSTGCGDATDDDCTDPDSCDGTGTCLDNHATDGMGCGDGVCNECDTGTCVISGVGTQGPGCTDNTNDDCDNPDSCDNAGACLDNLESDGTACGDLVCNECDTGTCVPSGFGTQGPGCTDDTNDDCDNPDSCDSAGACLDNLENDGTACGDLVCNECETGTCMASDIGTQGPGCDDTTNDDCDNPDSCDNAGTCLDNLEDNGIACGDGVCDECSAGSCMPSGVGTQGPGCTDDTNTDCDDPDSCDSSGNCETNQEDEGNSCDDGNDCTSASECDEDGECEPTVTDVCEVLWCFEVDPDGFTDIPETGTGTVAYGTGLVTPTSGDGNDATEPAACPASGDEAIEASGWNTAAFDAALAADHCFTFTFHTGLDPLFLRFDNQAAAGGPGLFGVEVEGDGAPETVIENVATDSVFTSHPMREIDISGRGLDAQNDAIVRICGYGSGGGGLWRLDNVHIFSGVSCVDGMENNGETDVDCGGPNCGPCDFGERCLVNADCDEAASFLCDPEAASSAGGDPRCNCDTGGATCLVTSELPDGSTFDIQSAIDAVASGGQVLVPFEVYISNTSLLLHKPLTMTPASQVAAAPWAPDLNGTRPLIHINAVSPAPSVAITASSTRVEHFMFFFPTLTCADSVEGMVIQNAQFVQVHDNHFLMGGGAGSIALQSLASTNVDALVVSFNMFDGGDGCIPAGDETTLPIPGHYQAVVIREDGSASNNVNVFQNTITGRVSRAIALERPRATAQFNRLSTLGAVTLPAAQVPIGIEVGPNAVGPVVFVEFNRIGGNTGMESFETGVLVRANQIPGFETHVNQNCFLNNNTALEYLGTGIPPSTLLDAASNRWDPNDGVSGLPIDCGGVSANNCATPTAQMNLSAPLGFCQF